MSFVMEPEVPPPEEGEQQRKWLQHLEEEAMLRGRKGQAVSASLQAKREEKLRRNLIIVWGFVLLLLTVHVGVYLGATVTKRGKDNRMWLITAALMDASLVLGALLLSGVGLCMRDEIYMRQSSILQLITASWLTIQVLFNMVFVVILSKIGGEWQRYGSYTSEQIERFNSYITALVVVGGLMAPLTFLCSKLK